MDNQKPKGKKSREFRRRASPGQVEALEKVYADNNTPDPLQMIELGETLDLAVDWLYNWFYRRKRKDGRCKNRQKRNRGKKNPTVKSDKGEASSPTGIAAAEGSCTKQRKVKAKKNTAPAAKPRNSPVQGAVAQSTGSASPPVPETASALSNQRSHLPIYPDPAPETNAAAASPQFSPAEDNQASMDVASAPYPSFLAAEPPAIPASFFTSEMSLEIFGQGPLHLSSNATFFPSENPMAGMDVSPMHYLGHESTLQGLVDGWLEGYRPVEGIHF